MSLKGYKQSPEHVAKRIASARASGFYERCAQRLKMNPIGRRSKQSEASNLKRSLAMRGRKNSLGCKRSQEFKDNLSRYWKGKPLGEDQRRKIGDAHRGQKCNWYVDGKGYERAGKRTALMQHVEYKIWKTRVFSRDSHKCVLCGSTEKIQADHIKPLRLYPELALDENNGRTLCSVCHRKTDTYGGKFRKWLKQNMIVDSFAYAPTTFI
jgi:hypothetical protein